MGTNRQGWRANTPLNDPDYAARRATVVAFLGISTISGVGYWTLRKLIADDLVLLLKNEPEFEVRLRASGFKGTSVPSSKDIWAAGLALSRRLHEHNVELLFADDARFPQALRTIEDPPGWLFVQGSVEELSSPSIAIVGTRKPTEDGLFLADLIGHNLSSFGATTVSGLATGIDQRVHSSSIRHRLPTIAVLGTGIFNDYPKGSEKLKASILAAGGSVISEYLPNDSYSGQNFVRRNRLQAGLARVTIPVEWSLSSGTAHTVAYTVDAKRGLICLRLQVWSEPRTELIHAAAVGGEVFTVPQEQDQLVSQVRHFLTKPLLTGTQHVEQLKLFGRPND